MWSSCEYSQGYARNLRTHKGSVEFDSKDIADTFRRVRAYSTYGIGLWTCSTALLGHPLETVAKYGRVYRYDDDVVILEYEDCRVRAFFYLFDLR